MFKFEKQNKKQFKTIVTQSFGMADAFSLTPPLRIFKQERFSTQIGKLASISLLIIFLIQFTISLRGVLNYDVVNVVQKQIYSQNPQPMYFTPDNFTLALAFSNTNQLSIENIQSLLTITVQNCQVNRTLNSAGALNISRKCFNYPVETCSMANHFPTDVQQSMFKTKNLSNLYCLSNDAWKNRSIVLQGIGSDTTICQNTSKSQNCASQSEIESKLNLIYYSYYFNDVLVQMDSVTQPLQPLIILSTSTVSRLQTKTILQNHQIQQTQTDTGYVFDSSIQQNGLSIYNTQSGNDPYNGQYVLLHLIQQYNIIMNYKRTYQKVQAILGQLGGLWQLMYYGVLLVINPIVSMNMNMALANKIFSFSSEENHEQDIPNSSKLQTNKKSIFSNQYKKKLDINDDNELARFLKTKKCSLKMSIKFILLQLCGCRKQEKQQLDYAKQKILNKLDVSYILTKLIEIDKLKQILLTKDQRHLFNHLPKPTIPKALFVDSQRLKLENNAKHEIILQEEKSDLMKLQEAFAAYKNITMNSNPETNSIDYKLIHHLDSDIHNLFKQIEQEVDDLPNSNPFKRSIAQSIEMSQVRQDIQYDSIRRQIISVVSESQIYLEDQAQMPK